MFRLSVLKIVVALLIAATAVFGTEGRAEAQTMLASWYGPGFEGNPTASGEIYNPWGYTAAHKTLPLGTQLLVSYGGRSVQVTVNDRGPYVGSRELDLSQGAAEALGLTAAGVDYVTVTPVGGGGYPAASGGYSGGVYTPSGGGYVVQPGDTLSGIAARLGVSVGYLAGVNGIADPDFIYGGQTLYY